MRPDETTLKFRLQWTDGARDAGTITKTKIESTETVTNVQIVNTLSAWIEPLTRSSFVQHYTMCVTFASVEDISREIMMVQFLS